MQQGTQRSYGNYRIVGHLGHGGFAEVYLGEHIYLHRQAAIKVLSTSLSAQDQPGFLAEARIVAHLRHPHIVHVLEAGIEEETPFLVMTYAPHGTLRQRHPRGSVVPLATVVSSVMQIAAALHYAHQQKLIHRDVKPENMLVSRSGEILLSDFGIATQAHSSRSQSVVDVIGTVAYMASEQLRGRPCAASDQYALAVVAYEWLCGSHPFDGSNYLKVARSQLSLPPQPLRERVPALAGAVDAVIMQALEKNHHQRFASVQAFAESLENAWRRTPARPAFTRDPGSARQTDLEEAPTIACEPPTRSVEVPEQVLHHFPRRTLVTGLAGLTLASAGVLWLTHTLTGNAAGHTARTSTLHFSASPDPESATLAIYRAHSAAVYGVAWSPDGKRLASWSDDGSMRVWDALSGQTLATYRMQDVMGWSPDWRYVASGDTVSFRIQEVASGRVSGTYISGASGGGR
jgi:serine/threonine protein kinase